MRSNLYFDYCSSSPIHDDVLVQLLKVSKDIYSNPSSVHSMGKEADDLISASRTLIANTLSVGSHEVFFTSGATESNNLAIMGTINSFMCRYNSKPHIIISAIEHSSIYNCCKHLEDTGIELSILSVDANGRVNIDELRKCIKKNTMLISIMHVNNETGVIQPIIEIGKLAQQNNILFHVDGVQGFGKVDINLDNIDLYTISGHKIGAPKGVGMLIIKENVDISPLMYGGGQESGIRPGTVNVPQVVCIAEAIRLASLEQDDNREKLINIHKVVRDSLGMIPELVINSPNLPLVSPHILNFSYPGVPSAIFISILEKKGIVVSSQSACSSKSSKLSRVLMEITHNEEISSSSIRLSFHDSNTTSEIKQLVEAISKSVHQIKEKGMFSSLLEEEQYV